MTEKLDQLRKDFDWFRSECIKLRNTFNVYHALYESDDEETDAALRQTACLFFHDLNDWLIQLLLLQIGRLTDPARTSGRENLTVCWIVEEVGKVGRLIPEIDDLGAELMRYRQRNIRDVRNKYISHNDLKAFQCRQKYGQHRKDEAYGFFENLQKFTDEVGNAIGDGPLDYSVQAGPGDVQDLIRALKRQVDHD